MTTNRPRFLLAGAAPGSAAGNSVSTEVLYDALSEFGEVDTLTHEIALLPTWRVAHAATGRRITIGTQPVTVHGEAALAGRLHRGRLQEAKYVAAWAVNSRYAGSLVAADIPYAIWEPTTLSDELRVISAGAARRAGRGSGIGRTVHAMLQPVGLRFERALYTGAHAVVAMSAYTRQRILDTHRLQTGAVRVLHHPPTRGFLDALARAKRTDRSPARAGDGPTRVLFVGRLDDPRKNFTLLIDAYEHLRAAGEDVSLTAIGPANEHWTRTAGERATALGIHVRGRVAIDELATAYLSHDLLVLPSLQEGFGIVVAEAMHAGLPIVSTRCGGPEQILTDSGGGVLVGFDVAEMADAIRRLRRDGEAAHRCSELGLAYARRELSMSIFIERVGRVVQTMSGRSAPSTIGHPVPAAL